MGEQLIVRYGDLTLKGKNKKFFILSANKLIRDKLKNMDVEFKSFGERAYIDIKNEKLENVLKALEKVSGIDSYSLYEKCELNIDEISKLVLKTYDKYHKENESFKIEARRTNKMFPLDSYEIMKETSKYILKNREYCKVDVHNPDLCIHIEIREDGAYVLTTNIIGMGGFPTGTGGKALLMMSGGIDSPVAAYELIKQGMTIEIVHFESTPLTSIESAQKVIDLAKKICAFTKGEKIIIHMVPFMNVHQEILSKVNEEYLITIMRRCMYRIGEKIAKYRRILAIANGESLGQVASQTVESMSVINEVTNMPILRPLLTMDKRDIIKIARKIETFDISIKPFEDCCTVYVPKRPVIKPNLRTALEEESKGRFDDLINDAFINTKRFTIYENTELDLASLGFSVSEAIEEYKKQGDNNE